MYKRLRELREDKDLLQKQIAITLKITRQQYGLYESGIREIPTYLKYCLKKIFSEFLNPLLPPHFLIVHKIIKYSFI